MFGKNNMADLMKQAKKMQEEFEKTQQTLAAMEVTGTSGAGLVKVIITGNHEVKQVHIDPSLTGESLEIVADLVAAAFNDAKRQIDQNTQEKMGSVKSMLPAGIKLPF